MNNTFIVFKGQVLLEYLEDLDAFSLVKDSGVGFPYEAYSDVVIEGHEFYLVHLDDRYQVPFSEADLWIDIGEVLSFIETYKSATKEGEALMEALLALFNDIISRDILY